MSRRNKILRNQNAANKIVEIYWVSSPNYTVVLVSPKTLYFSHSRVIYADWGVASKQTIKIRLLQHSRLHYNVALVSIKNFLCPANLQHHFDRLFYYVNSFWPLLLIMCVNGCKWIECFLSCIFHSLLCLLLECHFIYLQSSWKRPSLVG